MREYLKDWNTENITQSLVQEGITWRFNPPASPHFGGVWERLVRSCKKAMYAVLGSRSVTEDVLSTTMCLVEQILNGRPITPVSSDVQDLEALTPNHFLLGYNNVCLPCLPYASDFVDHRKLFRQTQAYADLIWNRFRKEYVPLLNNRSKWKQESKQAITTGDLVWIIEDSDKRGQYVLGRVVDVNWIRWCCPVCFYPDKRWYIHPTSSETGSCTGTGWCFLAERKQGRRCWSQLK